MKPSLCTCLLVLPLSVWAQGTPEAPAILEAGPHHRVLTWSTIEQDEAGNEVSVPHQVSELASGLNWLNPLTRQWEESVEAFEITPEGYAVAQRGQHKLILGPNINQGAAVDVEMPSGQRLRSNPMGLSFFDTASGQNVLLAEVKDCVGEQVTHNVIVFPDAFDNLKAALRYTYTKAGFEQDVILYEDPGSPADYGLDPATTRVEMYTEFHQPPTPRRIRQVLDNQVENERLEFDGMAIGEGVAYVLGQSLESVEVGKAWEQLEGRDFLVESVPYLRVQALLARAGLAKQGGAVDAGVIAKRPGVEGRSGVVRLLVAKGKRDGEGMLAAAIRPQGTIPESGVVVDYPLNLTGPPTGNVFRSDYTYHVTGSFDVSGTATFEAGTVIKYTAGQYIRCNGAVVFKGDAYRPVVFTAKDDDSVGEIVSGSTHSPSGYYANPALEFRSGGTQPKHVRVAYAQLGMFFYDFSAGNGNSVDHAQFVNCGTALQFNGYGTTYQNFRVGNVLIHNVGTAFYGYSFHGTLEHLTLDTVTTMAYDYQGASYGTSSSLSFLNSLLVSVGGPGGNPPVTVTYNPVYTKTASSGSGVFQQAGAGYHYLVAESTYRNSGSTAINANLAADLRQMTTYAPVTLTSLPGYPLAPQAGRDADTYFDIGYHYAPLDYLCSQINVGASTLVLTNGVAVGLYRSYGFSVGIGGLLASEGLAEAMNRLVWYPSVQEQPIKLNGVATGSSGMVTLAYGTPNPRPALRFRFTDLACLGRRQLFFYNSSYPDLFSTVSFSDCWLRGLNVTSQWYPGPATGYGTPTVSLTNNALERATLSLFNGYQCSGPYCYTQPLAVNLYNNLFWNTSVLLTYKDSSASQHPAWKLKDNLYHNATNTLTTTGNYQNYVSWSNNGYVNYSDAPVPTVLRSVTDVPPNSGAIPFSYAPALGDRRWAHLSTDMINHGSRNAASAGLYHYTVRASNVKEGDETPATVDIGYHDLAVVNVALNQTATQSSLWPGGEAIRAVDGNTDGTWGNGSISHTLSDVEAWWHLDLGVVQSIAWVNIWNRTDCCGDRLSNFYVFISDSPFQSTSVQATLQQAGVRAFYFTGPASTLTSFSVRETGRYLRVQLTGQNYLSLAEVQVFTGELPDYDADGLADYFEDGNGNGTFDAGDFSNLTAADADGDGLTDSEEYLLGYDPNNAHTGGSVASDGDKDYDGDLLSNLAELRRYGSKPTDQHSFNPNVTDAEFKFTAKAGEADTEVQLSVPSFPGGMVQLEIYNAPANSAYDLYFTPDLNEGWRWTRYYSGSSGQTVITCPIPPYPMAYFCIGSAADSEIGGGDGLKDGYEVLVSRTSPDTDVSDGDTLPDCWEVEYGLDAKSADGADGDTGNPDNDAFTNSQEWKPGAEEGVNWTDPKRHNVNVNQRPIVTVTATDPTAREDSDDNATFIISRTGGTASALTVYYVLGGTATVGTDYTLSPTPSGQYPGYSVTIEQGSSTRQIQVGATSDGLVEGSETVILGLAPDPGDNYVIVDAWQAGMKFKGERPHRAMAAIRDRVCHTYESDADFRSGVFMGVDTSAGSLHLNTAHELQKPYVNVACSGRGTVARVDVTTGVVIGEYLTAPEDRPKNPSRTTVDQFGNVWVANRDEGFGEEGLVNGIPKGSITRIGLVIGGTRGDRVGSQPPYTFVPNPDGQYLQPPFNYCTVMDRDGDGLIKTSRGLGNILGWTNQRGAVNGADTFGGVSTADDELIAEFVRVEDFGTRTIAVDKFNDIWVGGNGLEGSSTRKHQKVSGLLAQVVAGTTFTVGCGGYGAVIDPSGVLWSADQYSSLLRYDPASPPGQCLPANTGNYGLAVDPASGQVWHTWAYVPDGGAITKLNANGTPAATYTHLWDCAQGVVVDNYSATHPGQLNNVWIAHSHAQGQPPFYGCESATHIGRMRTDGTTDKRLVDLRKDGQFVGQGPTGVSVDSLGKIWVACEDTDNVLSINPDGDAVEWVVPLGAGAAPYNYSDMTGFNNINIVNKGRNCPLKGYWTVIEDGGSTAASSLWTVSWTATTPNGTTFQVYARASDERVALSNKLFVQANDGQELAGVRGRFLEVRTALTRNASAQDPCADDPYLENLTLCRSSSTLTLVSGLTDQVATEGETAVFQVVAIGTEPLTYTWYRNDVVIPNASGPEWGEPSVDCLDQGSRYRVHIEDASGDQVESGPVTLSVEPRLISIPSVGVPSVYPAKIRVEGAPTTISGVTITLTGFTHARPDDVDILVVSPTGQAVMLMSDAGGTTGVNSLILEYWHNYVFPPDSGQLGVNGTKLEFDASNYEAPAESQLPQVGPEPPPLGPYSSDITHLAIGNPNGTWRLYVVDDNSTYGGSISGSWCLSLDP